MWTGLKLDVLEGAHALIEIMRVGPLFGFLKRVLFPGFRKKSNAARSARGELRADAATRSSVRRP